MKKHRTVRPLTEPIEQIAGDISDPKRGLRAQVWLLFTLLAISMAILVTWVSGRVLRDSFREYIGSSLETLSSNLAVSLDRDIYLRFRDLQIIAQVPGLTSGDQPRLRSVLDQLQESFPIYAWIGLASPEGRVLVSTNGLLEGVDVTARPWFQRGREGVYFGDVHEARLLAELLPTQRDGRLPRFVDIAIPMDDGHVLAAHLDVAWAENVANRLIFANNEPTETQVLVIDADGDVIADSGLEGEVVVPSQLFALIEDDATSFATLEWSDGDYLTSYSHSNGFRDFPGFDWTVVVRQPTDLAYAPIANHSEDFLLWGLGVALMFGLVGWFVAHRITDPLRQLSVAARKVGAGVDNEVPLFPSRHDEVGQLAFAMHQMIRQLIERDERLIELNRELERRVQLRTADLVTANDELEAFNSMVSHDLRGPLTSMLGFLELLEADLGDTLDASAAEMLDQIKSSTVRMNELVEDHLNLSRASRVELNRETIDLSALCAEIIRRLRRQDPAREIDVEIEEGLSAFADEPLLEIALENLIGNAWKYSSRRERANIKIRSERGDGDQPFIVEDNGAGFDMSKADDLFAPFKRLHTSAEFQGTGVGLSTVKRIIERHGGSIWAESEPGKGARFFFTLA